MKIPKKDSASHRTTELAHPPEEWRVVKLGDLWEQGALWIKNGFPQGGFNEQGQGVPHLRPFNVNEWGELSLHQVKYVPPPPGNSPYWLCKGDIIFNNTNSEELVGKVAYLNHEGEFVLSNHMTIIRVQNPSALNNAWLAWWLLYLWYQGFTQTLARRHVNQASISLARLRSIPIPLPPLPEQRAIAHVLRTVREAKEATERIIAAARELKKSLMRHLFTYGPIPIAEKNRVRLQETEIGPIPGHWRVVRLGEVGKIITGKTPPTSKPEYWNGSIPFITPVDLNGTPITRASRTISHEGLTKVKPLPRGTVLVSCIGHIGKTGVVETEVATTNQQINAIIPDAGKADNFYLLYLLTYMAPHLKARARMTTVPILSKSGLLAVPIPLPPLPEQRQIAEILQAVDRKIEAEENRKAALEELFKSLLYELMTAKRRLPKEFIAQFADKSGEKPENEA